MDEKATAAAETFNDTLEDTKTSLSGLIRDILTPLLPVISSILSVLNPVFSLVSSILDPISTLVNVLLAPFVTILNTLGDALKFVAEWANKAFGWLGDLIGKIGDFIGGGSSLFDIFGGSHEMGLSYVPYDGYVAELHKGERVLTREEAADYKNGTGKSVSNVTNVFNIPNNSDPYYSAREIVSRQRRELYGYA